MPMNVLMLHPPTPDIPDYRVNASMFSLQAIGFDFAEPIHVKICLKTDSVPKVYVLILTCASCRAVHLKLILDMKIPAFFRGLKRFIARRGIPDSITSGNLKIFKSIEVNNMEANLCFDLVDTKKSAIYLRNLKIIVSVTVKFT